MRQIIFITGGQRSGKSSYAQRLAEQMSNAPVYLATARRWDEDFERRIARHQADRGDRWSLIEEEKQLSSLSVGGRIILLDCVTLWLTNIFHDNEYNVESALTYAKEEWAKFTSQEFTLIAVSNEIGMGLHGESQTARHFTDLQGWFNQHIAAQADHVYLMVSGIPVKIK